MLRIEYLYFMHVGRLGLPPPRQAPSKTFHFDLKIKIFYGWKKSRRVKETLPFGFLATKSDTEGARLLELLPALAGLPPRPDMYVTGFRAEFRRKGLNQNFKMTKCWHSFPYFQWIHMNSIIKSKSKWLALFSHSI